jgi:sugar phosphate isomerase/epimerase
LLIVAAALVGCSHESERNDEWSTTFARLNALSQEANAQPSLLAKYQVYKRHVDDSPALHQAIVQVMASYAAQMGAYGIAASMYLNPPGSPEKSGPLLAPSKYEAVDAADEIAALARERRIVMVNEAHHLAQTRLLTLQLLPKLRQLGYTHFAVETLDEKDTALAARGFPVAATGPYADEPLYGEIIRTALKLGYIVVPYETTNGNADPTQRENDQARHLADRVFARMPNARLLVHAGYSHIHKRADEFFTAPLALRLAQRTKLDPLCVDQVKLRFAGDKSSDAYTTLIDTFHVTSPTVLVARDTHSAWSAWPTLFDVSVILPQPRDVAGRPDWLTLDGARRPTPIALPTAPRPYLIEARYAGESDDAVPADRELIDEGVAASTLYLKPGDYRLRALDAANTVLMQQPLHVD